MGKMKDIIEKTKKFKEHPATKEALKSLKPTKSFWGIFSVILFFILPEIIAFNWGDEITLFCHHNIEGSTSTINEYFYKALEMLFGEGSWFNLIFGIGLLVWLFF